MKLDDMFVSYEAEKIIQTVKETEEAFIFETIQPFCENIAKMKITKKELVDAITKQRKIKPHYESDGDYNGEPVYDTWVCPRCFKRYEVDFDIYGYCPNCGQAIDWTEEVEE